MHIFVLYVQRCPRASFAFSLSPHASESPGLHPGPSGGPGCHKGPGKEGRKDKENREKEIECVLTGIEGIELEQDRHRG